MEFLGIGPWEVMVICLVALIFLGPKQMIFMARKAGEVLRQFQEVWQQTSRTIEKEIRSIEADASAFGGIGKEIETLTQEVKSALTINFTAEEETEAQTIQPPEPRAQPHPFPAWSAAAPNPPAPSNNGQHPEPLSQLAAAEPDAPPQPSPPPPDSPSQFPAWTNQPED